MTTPRSIAVLVGSLRKESFNRKLACALSDLAPPTITLEIIEIGDLPFYNQDLEPSPPPAWTAFRDRIRGVDGVLFVTPEYNRSVPAVLKNAIDVGSRPPKNPVWSGKPAGVISCSIGPIGGFGANHHLRQSLVFLNMPAMQQPEGYIGEAEQLFDASGKLTADSTREFLNKYVNAFAAWVDQHAARSA